MVNKRYKDAMLKSYDASTGMVTFEEYDQGRYSSFAKAMGFFCIYDKVQIKGYKNIITNMQKKSNVLIQKVIFNGVLNGSLNKGEQYE